MPRKAVVLNDSDADDIDLEREQRTGIDVEDVPPLPQELGQESSDSFNESTLNEVATTPYPSRDGHPTESDDYEVGSTTKTPQASPSKQSRADRLLEDNVNESRSPGSWRVKGIANDGGFAYLDEDDFETEDEDEDAPSEDEGWGKGTAREKLIGTDHESIEYEYETRAGIDVAADARPEGSPKTPQNDAGGIQYAVRPRTTRCVMFERAMRVSGHACVCVVGQLKSRPAISQLCLSLAILPEGGRNGPCM